jgi:hypothetical protein
MADEERKQSGGKSTDLAEGELDTVEESIRAHEGKCCSVEKGKPAEPDRRNMDLAEGERDTVEESIQIHEKKHDEQGGA